VSNAKARCTWTSEKRCTKRIGGRGLEEEETKVAQRDVNSKSENDKRARIKETRDELAEPRKRRFKNDLEINVLSEVILQLLHIVFHHFVEIILF
jgi:hypothetical protein